MLFHFHTDKTPKNIAQTPLARLGGELLVDTGNEDPSYIFRCQERYIPYAAFANLRPLLFIRDAKMESEYTSQLKNWRVRFQTLSKTIKINLPPLADPVFCTLDEKTLKITQKPENLSTEILTNQISPVLSTLFEQIFGENEQYRRAGKVSIHWNDKSNYFRLVEENQDENLPAHVPTTIIFAHELTKLSWQDVQNLFPQKYDHFFIKSSIDAGGELTAAINKHNFEQKISKIRADIAEKEEKGRKNHDIKLLIQHRVKTPENTDLPVGLGFTYFIHDEKNIKKITAAGQIYEDSDRRGYLGGFVDQNFEKQILDEVGAEKIENLCRLFAREGYRGPINFDAVRNDQNKIEFIFDCNPRMSATFPNLVIRDFLDAKTVVNIGYRGRIIYPDFPAKLTELKCKNLLFLAANQRGILPIPSFVHEGGFDIFFINLSLPEIRKIIADGHITTLADTKKCDISGIYF